jgi:hypothetical protein
MMIARPELAQYEEPEVRREKDSIDTITCRKCLCQTPCMMMGVNIVWVEILVQRISVWVDWVQRANFVVDEY